MELKQIANLLIKELFEFNIEDFDGEEFTGFQLEKWYSMSV
ncbi:hypothetical protein BANRA_02149 [Acinetobacter baumannii]|nr:hypothetical protein BANRA_02149 [Acinetobacter baumannii]